MSTTITLPPTTTTTTEIEVPPFINAKMIADIIEVIDSRGYSWRYEITKSLNIHHSHSTTINNFKFIKTDELVAEMDGDNVNRFPDHILKRREVYLERSAPRSFSKTKKKKKYKKNMRLLYVTEKGSEFMRRYKDTFNY